MSKSLVDRNMRTPGLLNKVLCYVDLSDQMGLQNRPVNCCGVVVALFQKVRSGDELSILFCLIQLSCLWL